MAGIFSRLAWIRPGQGKWPRFLTGGSAVALSIFGCITLHDALSYKELVAKPVFIIPGVDFDITWPLLISGIVLLLCLMGTYVLINSRKIVEFLLETEGEVKKVTWPGWDEVVGSSIVVVFTVVVLGLYIAFADYIFSKLMRTFVYG